MHDKPKFRWLPLDEVIGATAFALLLIVVPMVLSLERRVPADQDAAWHRRHEQNSAACRGQQYVAHCCDDARTDLTCISAELKGPK